MFLSWLCGALKYPNLFAQWNTFSSFWKVGCKTKSFKIRHADTVYDENDDDNADLGDGGYTKPGLLRNLK